MTTEAAKHATLIEALIAAQSEYPGIPREAEGQARGGKYRYATLAAVLEAVVPALNRHGVALIQSTSFEGESLTLHTILRHTSGEEIASIIPLPQPQSWQEWGIAMTYARRYTITALAGVAPEDDEDGAGAQGRPAVAASHGICPDHGVAWRQTQYGIGHPRGQGEPWCNKQPPDDLGWNAPPPDDAPARMPDPKAAAQAAPRMPVATAQAPYGVCEVHKVPFYKPRTGGAPGHYFTPNPPRGDGKGDWCHQSTKAPPLAEVAAEIATARVAGGVTKEGQGALKV